MSRVFEQIMDDIATASGCDWDFVVDMYNYLWETEPEVDNEEFAKSTIAFDWSARGDERVQKILEDLCKKTGYEYDRLFEILVDMIFDPDCDNGICDWKYFVDVTMERDW